MGAHVAVAAAMANAIKASGAVVRVAPADFLRILSRVDEPLVVVARGGVVRKHYKYLTSYKGLAFFTKSAEPLALPHRTEGIMAGSIAIPDV